MPSELHSESATFGPSLPTSGATVARRAVVAIGYLAIVILATWWVFNVQGRHLLFADASWLPAWKFLGFDLMHNHLGARAWLQGINPYLQPFGDVRGLYTYPPIVLPLFAWTGLVPTPRTATAIWILVIAAICALAVWFVQRFRRDDALSQVPGIALLALVLWSAPTVFAMERGNCDVLVLLCVLFSARALMQQPGWRSELLAGALLALAVTIKIYPLVAVAGLLALRRYRAVFFLACGIAVLVVLQADAWRQWLAVLRDSPGSQIDIMAQTLSWVRGDVALSPADVGQYTETVRYWGSLHSPGNWWPAVWLRLGLERIASWPFPVVQVVTLAPATLYGCWQLFRGQRSARMALPVLLWIMTIATFAMPSSWDYNLLYLPLLIVALWDRRDPAWIQAMLIVTSILWWIPFGPVGYDWSVARVVLKFASLHLATLLLVRRLNGSQG